MEGEKLNLLQYKNTIKTGWGDITSDIEASRNIRMEKASVVKEVPGVRASQKSFFKKVEE